MIFTPLTVGIGEELGIVICGFQVALNEEQILESALLSVGRCNCGDCEGEKWEVELLFWNLWWPLLFP